MQPRLIRYDSVRKRTLLIAVLVATLIGTGITIRSASAQEQSTSAQEQSTSAQEQSTSAQEQIEVEPIDPLIINGDPTVIRDVPYMVQIENGRGEHVCGGTLLSNQLVLTATHCLVRDSGAEEPGVRNFQVRYGATGQLDGAVVGFTEYHKAGAQDKARKNDVSVIVLDEPIPLSNRVGLVELASDREMRGINKVIALGWGKTSNTSGPADRLQWAEIDLETDAACTSEYGDLYDPERHLCGGGDTTDVCFGDSGGPIMIFVNGKWKQAGLTTAIFNNTCLSGHPSKFTDISYFRSFINSIGPGTTPTPTPGPTATPSPTSTPGPTPQPTAIPGGRKCNGEIATVILARGDEPTEGDDRILGTDGDDTIDGLGGNDIICGRAGNDTISGGSGNDNIFAGPGDDLVSGGPGNDVILGYSGVDTLRGDAGKDTLHGHSGPDHLDGGPDDDIIKGYKGTDQILGGDGNDVLYGFLGDDTIFAGAGDDLLFGGKGNDSLFGGSGVADICRGGEGADSADTACETIYGVPQTQPAQ